MSIKKVLILPLLALLPALASAQDVLPADNGLAEYHTAPRYRESESHPLRVAAYILHPIGWVAREAIFRPLSYFASSTETRRSVMGFREPFDYRQPECFSADDSVPDCRSVSPFNYESLPTEAEDVAPIESRQVYFPNVNFDFDKRTLNALGKGRVRQIATLLGEDTSVHVVLQGHADFIGSEQYNEKLGLDRAEAVKKELIALGIAPERLSTVTFGETQPVFPEKEDWARAVNRRVETYKSDLAPPAPVRAPASAASAPASPPRPELNAVSRGEVSRRPSAKDIEDAESIVFRGNEPIAIGQDKPRDKTAGVARDEIDLLDEIEGS